MINSSTQREKSASTLSEQQRFNQLLLDSLPHPAMLINTSRKVLAANKCALEVGVIVGDYCWKEFGKCLYLSNENREHSKNDPDTPGIRCTFCLADEAMSGEFNPRNDPAVNAFDRVWDTHWVPLDQETYLHYAVDITERDQAERALQQKTHDLNERVKELNCLITVTQIKTDPNLSLDETLQRIVELIPRAWQYPEITCARIVMDGDSYTTANFVESDWCQAANIVLNKETKGRIEVYYLSEKPESAEGPFLAEERKLLNTLAESIRLYLTQKRFETDLRITNLQLITEGQALQEANTTLKGVLTQIETEKKNNMLTVQSHIDRAVMPLLRQLGKGATDLQASCIALIENNLTAIASPFISKLESQFARLSPREVEISKLVKDGLSSKDIAALLSTSEGTVRNQRKSIRRKLGIATDKVSLASFLRSI